MSSHVTSELLYTIAFDRVDPDAAAREHLGVCASCRTELAYLHQLAGELGIARRSQPSPASLARYAGLFSAVQQQGAGLSQLWQRITAVLTWDSRQQPALQGVRSGAAAPQRLLYDSPPAEIELLLEAAGSGWQLEGEILARDPAAPATPALVQLLDASGSAQAEAETLADGRFHLRDLAAGAYELVITPPAGPAIVLSALEIG